MPVICTFENQCGRCITCYSRARRALRRLPVSEVRCEVPSCEEGNIKNDCCYDHSVQRGGFGRNAVIHNDGIIDWVAIDVASRGLREVRLTWVEKDIAVAVMLAKGYGIHEAAERIGARVSRLAAEKIAKAGVLEKLEAELEYFDGEVAG